MPLALAAAAVGCVAALREPPSPAQLGGAASADDRVDELLERATRSYQARTNAEVRSAADLYLRAAAIDERRADAWVGATRALVWLADHLEDGDARERTATSAVHAAQWCDRVSPDDATCQFWLAVALGIQARERRLTGHDALPRMVDLLRKAGAAEPALEQAGPDRVLALVYLRAPGWPSGPGDPELGLEYARRAVELRPDYPPNRLALAEALRKVEQRQRSREVYEQALALAREAVGAGEPDAAEWVAEAERALAARR